MTTHNSANTKVSVRIDPTDLAIIQSKLKEFGCKSISDYLRIASSEKLDRNMTLRILEEHIMRIEERQKILDTATAKLLRAQAENENITMETLQKITENLTKIALKIG
jgi:molecular chaperone GrpE (heat shock protein)